MLSTNQSPDVGFDTSLNPYRGCEHGCSYCYARPTHEYLGFSAGLDFETKIMVKHDAPELLRRELLRPGWKPQVVALSGVTDAYQPIEHKLGLTRRCLEVLAEFRNPVLVVTKNHLVVRDRDLLGALARDGAAAVFLSITTLDVELARRLEPRASAPERRLQAIAELSAVGVPCGVLAAPIIPALNDHEIPRILEAAHRAGAVSARWVLLRLPYGLKQLFEEWLRRHYPDRADRVLNRLRDQRGGRLNETGFGQRMRGTGPFAEQTAALFRSTARKLGLDRDLALDPSAFRLPPAPLPLFDP